MTTIYQVYKQSETKTFIIGETGNHNLYLLNCQNYILHISFCIL